MKDIISKLTLEEKIFQLNYNSPTPGDLQVFVGGSLPGKRSEELGASKSAKATIDLK